MGDANTLSRYSRRTGLGPVAWALGWRCALTPSSGSGETARSSTCTRRWNKLFGRRSLSFMFIRVPRKACCISERDGFFAFVHTAHVFGNAQRASTWPKSIKILSSDWMDWAAMTGS